jgi:predicted transcriptional regulator
MHTATIRLSEPSHRILRELAKRDKKPMQAVIEQALESYRRQRFLEGLNDDFMALRENESEWNAELAERREWDLAASDGSEE